MAESWNRMTVHKTKLPSGATLCGAEKKVYTRENGKKTEKKLNHNGHWTKVNCLECMKYQDEQTNKYTRKSYTVGVYENQ